MLKAFVVRPDERAVETSSEEEIAKALQSEKGSVWVDLESPTDSERGILERVFKFHALSIENTIALSNHPRIDDYGDYLYRVVHGVTPTKSGALSGALEVYLTVLANRTNEVMKVLTVFSIIIMSASFVAGLYGMNVPIPGGAAPWMFWALLGLMSGISLVLLIFFKRRRWI